MSNKSDDSGELAQYREVVAQSRLSAEYILVTRHSRLGQALQHRCVHIAVVERSCGTCERCHTVTWRPRFEAARTSNARPVVKLGFEFMVLTALRSGEVRGAARAHKVRNQIAAAYGRSDLFERRRRLMDDWAAYLAGKSQEPEAGPIR